MAECAQCSNPIRDDREFCSPWCRRFFLRKLRARRPRENAGQRYA